MKKFFTYAETNAPAPKNMDIQQQKEILLKWIRSCQTAEQLDLLARIVTEFVIKRFSDKIEFYEMELAKGELSDAIIEQRVITAYLKYKSFGGFSTALFVAQSYFLRRFLLMTCCIHSTSNFISRYSLPSMFFLSSKSSKRSVLCTSRSLSCSRVRSFRVR